MVGRVVQVPLPVDELPKSWYNVVADLPERLPGPLDEGGRLERLKGHNDPRVS